MDFISNILRAWLVLMIILIAFMHYLILTYTSPEYHDIINKIVCSASQIFGGILVLLNINSNLCLLGKKKLSTIFFDYLKSFKPKTKFPEIHGSMNTQESGSDAVLITGTVCNKKLSEKDKIEFAIKEIKELRKEIRDTCIDFEKKLSKINNDNIENEKIYIEKIDNVQNTLRKIVIGGIDTQVFGVFLVIYGEIASIVL